MPHLHPSISPFLATVTEKAMAPHSSTLAWKIPWTEEPGGLQSMGSHRVGHDWSNLAAAVAAAAATVKSQTSLVEQDLWESDPYFSS